MIRNIQLRHAGKYTCAVQTKVDSVSIATDVVVRGKGKTEDQTRICLLNNFFLSEFPNLNQFVVFLLSCSSYIIARKITQHAMPLSLLLSNI